MIRSFCCQLCAENFRFQSHLRNHEAVCKGLSDNPQCDTCWKNFKSEKTLQIHIVEVHEVKLEERSFSCLKCEKRFKLKNHLNRHSKICKGFKDYIKCDDCKKDFKSKKIFFLWLSRQRFGDYSLFCFFNFELYFIFTAGV